MTAEEYKQVRKELGLEQKELAEELGVDKSTIWRREHGRLAIDREAEHAILRLRDQKLTPTQE